MFALRFSKSATKTLLKMPAGVAQRMREELGAVAADPAAYRGDWKPLHGTTGGWRLRVGEWRAVCELRGKDWVVLVVKIAPRGDVYK